MKKTITICALTLFLSVCITLLPGCGIIILNRPASETTTGEASVTLSPNGDETTSVPDNTNPGDETTVGVYTPVEFPSRIELAEARLDELIEFDLSDYDIMVGISTDTTDTVFPEDGAVLGAALLNRNNMVSDKYGSDIVTFYDDTDKLYSDMLAATQSGSSANNYADLILLPADRAGEFLAKGLIKDMRTLPFYDATAGSTSGNIGAARYFDTGAVTDSPELIYALAFNRTLAGKDITDELYRASLTDGLSWEMIFESTAKADIGTASAIAVRGDDQGLLGELAALGANIEFVSKTDNGLPSVNIPTETVTAADALISLIRSLDIYIRDENSPASNEIFTSGYSLFYIGTISELLSFYDEKTEWGLLTLPASVPDTPLAVTQNAPVICLTSINVRPEQTGIWLSAMNAASGEWIRDQYLAIAVESYLRDNHSCLTMRNMLEKESRIEFARLFAPCYEDLDAATYLGVRRAAMGSATYESTLSSLVDALNKKLQKLP